MKEIRNFLLKNIGGTEMSFSAVLTVIAALLDKVPTLFILFLVAVVLDYITGWVKAAFFTKDWDSKTGTLGAIKKVMYFMMIGTTFLIGYSIREMGNQIGWKLDYAMLIGWYVTAVLLVNEFTSITENFYIMFPDKVPIWLIKMLKICDNTLENKINTLVCKNQNCDACSLKERCNYKKEEKEVK